MREVVSSGDSMKLKSPHMKVGRELSKVRMSLMRLELKVKSPPDLK